MVRPPVGFNSTRTRRSLLALSSEKLANMTKTVSVGASFIWDLGVLSTKSSARLNTSWNRHHHTSTNCVDSITYVVQVCQELVTQLVESTSFWGFVDWLWCMPRQLSKTGNVTMHTIIVVTGESWWVMVIVEGELCSRLSIYSIRY